MILEMGFSCSVYKCLTFTEILFFFVELSKEFVLVFVSILIRRRFTGNLWT